MIYKNTKMLSYLYNTIIMLHIRILSHNYITRETCDHIILYILNCYIKTKKIKRKKEKLKTLMNLHQEYILRCFVCFFHCSKDKKE
ncbi:hypothetical protein PFAG_03850 [Plasmodium falciparum Santa Lucia]|uniref:Uncharacterized protein n=3 Tax=Plasmodium falciparum TaxID=5833 RepID=W7FBS6_PLAF8|nr:hypothetical protein PFNF135_04011 [Plasmodium falciparum NF135/5.C10]EUR68675.1 hypothetical protein PFBG_03906 [Plasmodium falciparum 7G8]EUT82474.1 hypothetical protein PFAG_03850 [Plasmodium falciparum Santa Lucia]